MPIYSHVHPTIEITMMLKGQQTFFINDQKHIIHGGDIFITRPNLSHGRNGELLDLSEYVWFQLDITSPGCSDNFLGLANPFGKHLFDQISQCFTTVKKSTLKDALSLRDAFYQLASDDLSQKSIGYSNLIAFLAQNFHSSIPTDTSISRYSSEILSAQNYIGENLLALSNINQISDYVNMSLSCFIKAFKAETGYTPHSYILLQKIELAKDMLKNTANSVTEISNTLNFSTSNHFTSVFKNHTVLTPTQYKSMLLSNQEKINPQKCSLSEHFCGLFITNQNLFITPHPIPAAKIETLCPLLFLSHR